MSYTPASAAADCLTQGHYADAVMAYEQAIASNPNDPDLYWNYGIALLLNEQEEEAQSVWMSVLMDAESEAAQLELTQELVQAIDAVASHCQHRADFKDTWMLRRYQCEFAPDDGCCARDAAIAGLSAGLLALDDAILEHLNTLAGVSDQLFSRDEIEKTIKLLELLLDTEPDAPSVQTFTDICVHQAQDTSWAIALANLFRGVSARFRKKARFLTHLMRHAIQLAPEDIDVLDEAIEILITTPEERRLAIELAERRVSLAKTSVERLRSLDGLMTRLMHSGGQNRTIQKTYADYKAEFTALAEAVKPLATCTTGDLATVQPYVDQLGQLYTLASMGFVWAYIDDHPQEYWHIRKPMAAAVQVHSQAIQSSQAKRFSESHRSPNRSVINRPLRIGYLADTFRLHSVGWLCRWLLKHHDRDRFDIHLYTSATRNDFIQQSLINDYGDQFHVVPHQADAIANHIFDDEIDVLIELDSMTDPTTLVAMALKPAPVQVSWLGYDASGLPAIDYFIADPYVLPDGADQYYQEKIWRLPQTYIAVDGFEFHTPTLRRTDLDIPTDAVVYLSSQTGYKRNPHNVKLQLQILKNTPNSYLLIKSFISDPDLLQPFFYDLAEEVGVSGDRLRFLPDFPTSFVHRANLQLADVVLDTYPYNGATTTLEALWMGLPIVTRVGEQFAARNSYTMMVNAGITEGIAWSDEEYVEWGIRFGHDEDLRRDVVWNLQRSRHSAPLWNAKQFTREMERAYEHMWRIYSES